MDDSHLFLGSPRDVLRDVHDTVVCPLASTQVLRCRSPYLLVRAFLSCVHLAVDSLTLIGIPYRFLVLRIVPEATVRSVSACGVVCAPSPGPNPKDGPGRAPSAVGVVL